MKAQDRNLIRIKNLVDGEFEIASKKFLEHQRGRLFKKSLDITSFTSGFNMGIQYLNRLRKGAANLESEDDEEVKEVNKHGKKKDV